MDRPLHVLVLGAGGFIGRHIVADLLTHGHRVTGTVRRDDGISAAFPDACFLALDLAKETNAERWRERLTGIDIVVNAAGLLRGRDMEAVHVAMPHALHAACAASGVRRVLLISAISARSDVATDYAASKLRGEEALRSSALAWTILRPSLVYGEGSYGGTSLLRGLAALPGFIPLPGDGGFAFSPIHVRDLARAVRIACEADNLAGQVLEPCGPETLTLKQLLIAYREWLGFGQAPFLPIPMTVMGLLARIGDVLGRGPVSTTSLHQIVAGNAGDGRAFADTIGFGPRTMADAFAERPAQVQDRWHARLYFAGPLIAGLLALMWLWSGLTGLLYGGPEAARFVSAAGLPPSWTQPLMIGSSLLDLMIAAALILGWGGRRMTMAQFAVVAGYTLALGILLPDLWQDPFGALAKNVPILALIAVHGVLRDQR
ncbi:MAG TPA: SDR family oxidoreductase [Allosphingosinicella sp.]